MQDRFNCQVLVSDSCPDRMYLGSELEDEEGGDLLVGHQLLDGHKEASHHPMEARDLGIPETRAAGPDLFSTKQKKLFSNHSWQTIEPRIQSSSCRWKKQPS